MNVRFFGGTKAEYLSLKAPRNPLGLYFCEDTQELFWGDLLLTDGIRVVPTHADLPKLSDAADGIVYYVTETRNGYTISPDRTRWLQTIYAPATDAYKVPESEVYNTVTTVGAVRDIEAKIYTTIDERVAELKVDIDSAGLKRISFAGIELTEVDGVFSIDRACARRALGFNVPVGQEEADIDLATKAYVDEQLAAGVNIDLANYYTKDEVNQLVPGTTNFVEKSELEGLASESYVDEKVANVTVDLTGYAKESWVEEQGYLTEHQSLDAYATKEELFSKDYNDLINKPEIPSIEGLATEGFVTEAINNISKVDLSGYATEQFVNDELAKINIPDTSDFITIQDVEAKNYLTAVPAEYATEEFVNKKIAEAELADKEADLEAYYTKSETETLVNDAIAGIEHPVIDLSEYAKKEDIPSTDGMASKDYVDAKISELEIQAAPDLSEYAKLSDIPSHDEFAAKSALQAVETGVDILAVTTAKERYEVIRVPGLEVMHRDDEIRLNTEHIELSHQNVGVGGEADAYYVGIKIYAPACAESVRQNITSAPGIQRDKEILPFTTADIDSYGRKYSTIWVKCAIYQNGAWLNYGMSSTSDKCLGYYYTVEWYDINSNIVENASIHIVFTNDACHYSNISDAVSRRLKTADDAIAAITIPEIPTNISAFKNDANYITAEELDNRGFITDISNKADINHTHDIYAVKEHEHKQYLTEHQDISHLATKAELPDVSKFIIEIPSEYITNEELEAKGYLTEHQSLDNYALKSEVEAKANNILFTTDKFVTKAFGGFTVGESLKDLTIAELLAKLLELADEKPVLPDVPVEPNGIVDTIINNKLPMYSINSNGEIVELSYDNIITYTEKAAGVQPTESGFYQVLNDAGEAVESGYQELTAINPDVPYIIAMPAIVDFSAMVTVYTYDTLEGTWKLDPINMSNNYDEISALCNELGVDISQINTAQYTLWADLEAGPSGKIHRFIITE